MKTITRIGELLLVAVMLLATLVACGGSKNDHKNGDKSGEDISDLIDVSKYTIVRPDVASRNILINHQTGEVKFCDVDNICIGNLPIDIMSKTLKEYQKVRGIDENTDAYMHSIMTLHSFDLDEDYSSPEEFSYYFEEDGKEILQSIRDKKSYNGEYIVQYVKKK